MLIIHEQKKQTNRHNKFKQNVNNVEWCHSNLVRYREDDMTHNVSTVIFDASSSNLLSAWAYAKLHFFWEFEGLQANVCDFSFISREISTDFSNYFEFFRFFADIS